MMMINAFVPPLRALTFTFFPLYLSTIAVQAKIRTYTAMEMEEDGVGAEEKIYKMRIFINAKRKSRLKILIYIERGRWKWHAKSFLFAKNKIKCKSVSLSRHRRAIPTSYWLHTLNCGTLAEKCHFSHLCDETQVDTGAHQRSLHSRRRAGWAPICSLCIIWNLISFFLSFFSFLRKLLFDAIGYFLFSRS